MKGNCKENFPSIHLYILNNRKFRYSNVIQNQYLYTLVNSEIGIQKFKKIFFQVEKTLASPSSISVNSNLPAELKVFTTHKIPTSFPCTFDLF